MDETILDHLATHAASRGDALAYTFVAQNDERRSIKFGELHSRAKSIGHHLLNHAEVGDRALLMYPAGLDFIEAFLGCLTAGIVPVPAYPPKQNRKSERVLAIAGDCRPRLLLCSAAVKANVLSHFSNSAAGSALIVTDEIEIASSWSLPAITSEDLAFLQYTSGATGVPKGVAVTHRNLIANQRSIASAFEHDQNSKVVSWLPQFHDMGLVGSTLQPLYVGFSSIHFSPEDFVRNPSKWLAEITRERATTSGAPNFAYDYCVDRIPDAALPHFDLTSWTLAFNGAEPVRAQTLDRFVSRFAAYGFSATAFFPCYGMAEATLFVTGGPRGAPAKRASVSNRRYLKSEVRELDPTDADVREVVSSGAVARDTEIAIVDPDTLTRLDDASIGEIWIQSPSVASGFWGRTAASAATFACQLPGSDRRWLRTGDIGFLRHHQLYVTGRIKDMIIVRGQNIHAEDVEHAARECLALPASYSAAAFESTGDGAPRLVLVLEQDSGLERDRALELYEIVCERVSLTFSVSVDEIVLLRRLGIPKTSSGKVCRSQIKHAYEEQRVPYLFRITKAGVV